MMVKESSTIKKIWSESSIIQNIKTYTTFYGWVVGVLNWHQGINKEKEMFTYCVWKYKSENGVLDEVLKWGLLLKKIQD
jgi:hypothetical protein